MSISITNAAVSARKANAISRAIGMTTQVCADRARNSEIWDIEGWRYIDFAGGIAVVNTGHCHLRVIEAVRAQLDRFTHTCHQVVPMRAMSGSRSA
jgi:4-aminobutyrate aminotransferase